MPQAGVSSDHSERRSVQFLVVQLAAVWRSLPKPFSDPAMVAGLGKKRRMATLAETIMDLSLLYAGTPDSRAIPNLLAYTNSIRPTMIEAVGAERTGVILLAFENAVMRRKRELEAGGASPA